MGGINGENVQGHARLEQRPHVPCEERNSPAWELMSEDGEPQRDDPRTVTVRATPRNADRSRSKRGAASPAGEARVTRLALPRVPGAGARPPPSRVPPRPGLDPGEVHTASNVEPY